MTYYPASLSGMKPYLSSFLASFEMLVNFKNSSRQDIHASVYSITLRLMKNIVYDH
jgi:hypothetical protein